MGHTATYDPTVRCVYIYGGSKNLKWFHDVHMLDLDEWKWQLLKVSGMLCIENISVSLINKILNGKAKTAMKLDNMKPICTKNLI